MTQHMTQRAEPISNVVSLTSSSAGLLCSQRRRCIPVRIWLSSRVPT